MGNKFKKGDWVRALVGDEVVGVGDVGRVAEGDCPVPYVDWLGKKLWAYIDCDLEPWKPKVGERVRVVKDGKSTTGAVGKLATLEEWSDGDFVKGDDYLLNIDGPVDYKTFAVMENYTRATIDCFVPARSLTIVAGRYYKTRDGRKVGPMKNWRNDSAYDFESNNFLWKSDGENYDKGSVHTIIAEWTEPSTKPTTYRTNVGAQVDTLADEYGPWGAVAEVAVAEVPTAKFKVGDVVVGVINPIEYVVLNVRANGNLDVRTKGDWQTYYNEPSSVFKPAADPAIVALIDGTPRPSTTPKVHLSEAEATKEAKRLAAVHKGQEFGVFVLAGAAHKVERVYEHEWQRLAAEGKYEAAGHSLCELTGMIMYDARRAAKHWAERAARTAA